MAEALLLKSGGGVMSAELTAKKSHVLEGYTAVTSDSDDDAADGTMKNRGALNWNESNTTKTVDAGYYSGGTLDSRPSYNKGVSDADGRVNTDSESYKKGYESGTADADGRVNKDSASYEDGYNDGYMSFLGGSTINNTICTDFGGNVGAGLQYDPLWTERKFDETNTFEIPKKYNGGTLYALDVTVKHSGMETYGQAYSASGSYKLMNYDGTDIAAGSYDTTGQDVDYVNIDFMSKPYDMNGDVLKMLIKASGRVRLETSAGGNEWARATMQFTVVAKYKIPKESASAEEKE